MRKTWSDSETERLKIHYQHMTNEELQREFPDRTLISVYKKAKSLGLYKNPYIEWKNRSNAKKREKASNWKGGRKTTKAGYTMILMPSHHRADKHGYVMEHIVIFERETGITIPNGCCIHHINGDKSDNRIQNLCMMTHSAHTIMHSTGRKYSEESKHIMSEKAKERLKDKTKHPAYKEINIEKMIREVENGETVEAVCRKYGICKSTYYEKKRGISNGT